MDDKKSSVMWEDIERHIDNINTQIKMISENLANINKSLERLEVVMHRCLKGE